MTSEIHPAAVIDPGAEIGDGVEIEAGAVVGPGVVIGDGTWIGAGAQVRGPSKIGRENRIYPYACLGFDPQDLKYAGEETWLEVGERNHFREFTTVHRGTESGGGLTRIGDDNLFMAYAHVAHDCRVGDQTVFANNGTLAGHVEVGDHATVGAFTSVHQFCRVGRYAYLGGYTVVTRDALPYVKTVGTKAACYGLNRIGLERKGFDTELLRRLEAAYRVVVRSRLSLPKAIGKLREEHAGTPEVDDLIEFLETSERGVVAEIPGRRGGRGGSS